MPVGNNALPAILLMKLAAFHFQGIIINLFLARYQMSGEAGVCQRAVCELSPQLLNPLGEIAPQPGGVNYHQSHKASASNRWCSEGGSKISRQGDGFIFSTVNLDVLDTVRSLFLQLAVSRREPQDADTSILGVQEQTFIWHSQSWMMFCSLKMGRTHS